MLRWLLLCAGSTYNIHVVFIDYCSCVRAHFAYICVDVGVICWHGTSFLFELCCVSSVGLSCSVVVTGISAGTLLMLGIEYYLVEVERFFGLNTKYGVTRSRLVWLSCKEFGWRWWRSCIALVFFRDGTSLIVDMSNQLCTQQTCKVDLGGLASSLFKFPFESLLLPSTLSFVLSVSIFWMTS